MGNNSRTQPINNTEKVGIRFIIFTFANMIGGSVKDAEKDRIDSEVEEIRKREDTTYINSVAKNIHIGEVSKSSKSKVAQKNGKSKKQNIEDIVKRQEKSTKHGKNNPEKEIDDGSR